MVIFGFTDKNIPPKFFGCDFRQVEKIILSFIIILYFLPIGEIFVYIDILHLNDFIRSVSDHFPDNFAIFFIPWIGSSIRLLKRNLIKKIANGVGKDSSEMVINLINIIIIIHGA